MESCEDLGVCVVAEPLLIAGAQGSPGAEVPIRRIQFVLRVQHHVPADYDGRRLRVGAAVARAAVLTKSQGFLWWFAGAITADRVNVGFRHHR